MDGHTQDVNRIVASVLSLPGPVLPNVLGVGAFLKNTLCLTRGREALISRDVGNLETVEAVKAFEASAERLAASTRGGIDVIAHDLHPNFHSTRYADELSVALGAETMAVQHHHAHVASVMAEYGLRAPVLGLALDGFGLGPNDESWGGELLLVDRRGYRRLGHLKRLKQPGGDKAAREPWRMGAAILHALGRTGDITTHYKDIAGAPVIAQMLERNVNCPETSSCGRLFDAACGLLGLKLIAQFEGEAPMALEQLATRPRTVTDGWTLTDGELDLTPLLSRLLASSLDEGANIFHGTVAAAFIEWVEQAAEATGVRQVVLCGGCFLNRVMSGLIVRGLHERRIETLRPHVLPPGDAAISLGQAWAAVMAKG